MFGQEKEPRPMTAEEQLLDQLQQANRKIEKLEKIVGALAVTNFLTQHEDGDEEVRDQSVEDVNVWSAEYKQQWKNNKEIAALEKQKQELDEKIDRIKWGTLTYKTSDRYGRGLGKSIISTQSAMVDALNQSFQNVYEQRAVDIQQERMNAFNASAARAEAAAICNGSK